MNTYNPDSVSPPGNTLLDLIRERDISVKELSLMTGLTVSVLAGILYNQRRISHPIARRLEAALGTPVEFWITRETRYREWANRLV